MPSYLSSLIPLAVLAVLAGWLAKKGSTTKGGWAKAALLACLVVGLTISVAARPAQGIAAENAAPQASEEAENDQPETEAAEPETKAAEPETKPAEPGTKAAEPEA